MDGRRLAIDQLRIVPHPQDRDLLAAFVDGDMIAAVSDRCVRWKHLHWNDPENRVAYADREHAVEAVRDWVRALDIDPGRDVE